MMVGQGEVKKDNFPFDVVAGTPIKLMEMAHCQGWDPKENKEDEDEDEGGANIEEGDMRWFALARGGLSLIWVGECGVGYH